MAYAELRSMRKSYTFFVAGADVVQIDEPYMNAPPRNSRAGTA